MLLLDSIHDLDLRQGAWFSLETPKVGSRGDKAGQHGSRGWSLLFSPDTAWLNLVLPASNAKECVLLETHIIVLHKVGNAVLIMKRFQLIP